MSGFTMPGGDPSGLEEFAAKLQAAAQRAGDVGASTRQLTSSIRSGANWTGDAADFYTDFTINLSQGPIDAEQPLSQIASAVRNDAGVLRAAHEKVQTYSSLADAAQNDPSGSMISTTEQAGQDASSAVSSLQQAASQAAAKVNSATADLENLAGKTGPVQSWISSQPGLGMTATEPLSGTIKDPIPEDLGTGTTKDPVPDSPGSLINADSSDPTPQEQVGEILNPGGDAGNSPGTRLVPNEGEINDLWNEIQSKLWGPERRPWRPGPANRPGRQRLRPVPAVQQDGRGHDRRWYPGPVGEAHPYRPEPQPVAPSASRGHRQREGQ